MSLASSDYIPSAYFYIGTEDSEDEESLDCESSSASSMLMKIWNDISILEEGYNPPLEIAMKILRIVHRLSIRSREKKQDLGTHNAFLRIRAAKVYKALLEYKEQLCRKVFSILDGKEGLDLSHEIKEEILRIKTELEQEKLLSFQRNLSIKKFLDLDCKDFETITLRKAE